MMDFHHRGYGRGTSLVILHGLLGSLDNWGTLAKKWSERFHVFTFDARNHGRSPHSQAMNYSVMAEDLLGIMGEHDLAPAHLIGHSMGGKTAMFFATQHPDLVKKLVIVDIAPKHYTRRHDHIFSALMGLDLKEFTTRKEVDDDLAAKIPEFSTRQFLMKNLARTESGRFKWKMNLRVLNDHYPSLSEALPKEARCPNPTLFVRGGRSTYILDEDKPLLKHHFPNSQLLTVKNAGHWVHADASAELDRIVSEFLSA